MSNVTSSSYPVITVTKSGDQFLVVQNGQLKKLTQAGLAAFIDGLAPDTVLELTDTPASYVGQQGKVLVVNPLEDGMVFEAATSGNFLALSDTPGAYGGNATKLAVVKADETGLEFIENFFIALGDTPATYTGQSEKVARVNTGATALEFVAPEEAAPARNITGGWFDYDNAAGSQAYTAVGTFVKVINDGLGTGTRSDFAPFGVSSVYDGTVSQFDFTQLSVGDRVRLRVDLEITTTATNQTVDVDIEFAIGGSAFSIAATRVQFKAAGTYQITPTTLFYVGESLQANPGEVQFRSDANATIDARGWFVDVDILGGL